MRKISQDEINQFVTLYKEHHSLRKVSRITKNSPNTIKKYVSNYIPINEQDIVKSLKTNNELIIGTYVGLWMGDGTQYFDKNDGSYTIKICSDKRSKNLNKFITRIIWDLFNKKALINDENNTNRAYIKFRSKYIYQFISKYTQQGTNKTHTVGLIEDINKYSQKFLEGVLLGAVLSDGYLKEKFKFNVVSIKFSKNIQEILCLFGFNPRLYVHDRRKYGWKNLQMVYLNKNESKMITELLNKILKSIGSEKNFQEIKYGPAGTLKSKGDLWSP